MRLQGRDLHAGLSGDDVATLHQELRRLGYLVPDDERRQRMFGPGTAAAVAAFRAAQGLGGSAVVDIGTAAALDNALEAAPTVTMALSGAEPAESSGGLAAGALRIGGTLYLDRGGVADGVTVRLYARGFGGRATLIGEALAGRDGRYTVDGQPPTTPGRLDVRVVGADGREVSLTGSGQRLDATSPLDVVVPASVIAGRGTEFSRLTRDVAPHLGADRLAQAREDDERRDLTLLREATGWDARLLALASSAERLASAVGIDTEVAYGLLRAGLPGDPVQLARISPAGVGHALRAAVAGGVVALDERTVASAQAALDRFGRTTRRGLAIQGSASSYGSMLRATGLNDAQQDRFDEIFSAHSGSAPDLWRKVHDAGLPADQIRLTAQLGALTYNSARLCESLRAEIRSTDRLGPTLVGARLYQPQAWQGRLRALAGGNDRVLAQMIPPAYEGESVQQRLDAYSADLAFKVRRSFPTQVLRDRVRAGELLAGRDPALAQDVAAVLDRAAAAGFVPGQQALYRFLVDEGGFAGVPAERVPAAAAAVATLTRQYQITASDEALEALQRNNLHSAYQVSAMPQRAFLARYGSQFPSPAEAELTWRRAQQVTAVTLNVVAAAKQIGSARLLPALAAPAAAVDQSQTELVKQFPTLESLLGSLDFCQCEHCRSVLSPAAYLVDILKFLDDAPPAGAPKRPYEALVARRPDLPHTLLSCSNTNTALPYVDIVNEILEYYVAHNHQLAPQAAFDTGSASTEDLVAEPQNLLPAAYTVLRQAKYPLSAPFDLWLATVRAFVGHFQVPFWELLEALRPSDELYPAAEYGLAAVAYEQSGFTPAELALLVDDNPLATWPARYGYAPGAPQATWGELSGARLLSRRLGVTYHELVSLLRTTFVNPQPLGPDRLVLADPQHADPCSWEQTELRHANGAAATPMDFLLLNHFVRIWRRLGWSIVDTDRALVTFLPRQPDPRTAATIGPATATALLGVARLARLEQLLGAGSAQRQDLLVLWAPLSDGRYEELFLTGTPQTRDPAFEGQPGSYLTAPEPLADHLPAVQAALQLGAEEIGLILADAGIDSATAPLSMATISLLHRHGLLARLLRIQVAELLALKELSGLDPFRPLPPGPVLDAADDHPYQQTIRFVETVRLIAESGLTVADLDFLLRHRFDAVGPLRAAAGPPLGLVRALGAELARIRAEFSVPTDPLTFTDEVLARALGLVLEPSVVVAFLDAWTGVAPLPPEVFDEHLRRHTIAGVGEVGFLAPADLATLFSQPADQDADAARRALLAGALLPAVQGRLSRQAVVEAVANDQDADAALVEALLTRPELLDEPGVAPGSPLVDAFLAIATTGLTVGNGQISGFLQVPASGGYQLTARSTVAGTQLRLRFDHQSEALVDATTAGNALAHTAELELRGGVPYGFTLEHTGGDVELLVRGQRLSTVAVSKLVTYPRSGVDRVHRAHLLLSKVLRLAGALGLVEVELRHLLTHADDFDGLDLGALPTSAAAVPPGAVQVRFWQVMRLVGYARLREDLAADPADLVAIFAHARRRLPVGGQPAQVAAEVSAEVIGRLAAITRRDHATVGAAAALVGASVGVVGNQLVVPVFTQEQGLSRVWRVLGLANRIGVDPAALGRWATPSPNQAVARDVRNTVKSIYPPDQWRRVAQPIFDRLRQQRRDALVAEVLRASGYDRIEQLFEHFLIDPGTEPVVHTSRIRLAISSVQLFVQRCLLNLEEGVAPSSINAEHWEWMKRYRVWEANRRMFLWPENWLEPEFRDDKTHLFTELESALLESNLDEQAVEAAFFGYLRGLDEIARLDIRATYLERKSDPAANILHVLARTVTAPYRYFYRTWSRRSWSPWQPVTANIDGDHVTMVKWQGRVHLFWVVFLPQAEPKKSSSTTRASRVRLSTISRLRPTKRVEMQLYWSCYTPSGVGPGEWSNAALATAENPKFARVDDDFKPAKVFIWSHLRRSGAVSVGLIGQGLHQSFSVVSRHAPPRHQEVAREPVELPYLTGNDHGLRLAGQGRWRGSAPKFRVHVEGYTISEAGLKPCDVTEDILADVPGAYHLVVPPPPAQPIGPGKPAPPAHPDDPFFFVDASNTFFVEPDWNEFSLGEADHAVVAQSPVWHDFDAPEYWAARPVVAAAPAPPGGTPPHEAVTGRFTIGAAVDGITRPEAVVRFGGRVIGADGLQTNPGRLSRSGPHGVELLAAPDTEPTSRS